MRPGARIAVDVGRARVGLASCDPHGMLATPVSTLQRRGDGESGIAAIVREAEEREAVEIVVGLPLSLNGSRTESTRDAEEYARRIAGRTAIPVRLVDERLSTVSAQAALHRTGRDVRRSRSVVDQVAAVIILQHALDYERSIGDPPGTVVASPEGSR